MPEVYTFARPAQMGNLNKDSIHPNPWYPPTEYERMFPFAELYRISGGNPKGPLPKRHNFIEDDPFLQNIRWAAFKGWGIGSAMAYYDITNVHAIDEGRARLARYFFIMPPYIAMGVSWICAREFLGNLSTEKNAFWTYPVSMIAPGTIWGIFRNSFERGARATCVGATLAAAWKFNKENGNILAPEKSILSGAMQGGQDEYDPETGINKAKNWDVDGWKGHFFNIDSVKTWWTPTEEPNWKKHVSPEEAKRGPPTNF